MTNTRASTVLTAVFAVLSACAGQPESAPANVVTQTSAVSAAELIDPGTDAWQEVPESEVERVCGLDPAALARADEILKVPWAIVRHGRLCHSFKAKDMKAEEALSTTKTMGAVVVGMVSYQTRDLVRAGRKTGPFSDADRVDFWLDTFKYNPDAQVGHVLGMVAQNADLSLGHRKMVYDALGTTQVDSLSDILNTVIAQNPTRLGANLEQFTQRFLFGPLGMTQSSWTWGSPKKLFAWTWKTTVFDMARLGLLMLHGGVWNGERLVDAQFIYRMTHPAFEDANTGWGYLTWVNSASNHHFDGVPVPPCGYSGVQQEPRMPGACAPVALASTHPHGLSEAADCNYLSPYTCEQRYDVGVWQAVGLFGQLIQGHPGLDLVIVAKNATGFSDISGLSSAHRVWEAVRPAVVNADPRFHGDDVAFCDAYGRGEYAPALQ